MSSYSLKQEEHYKVLFIDGQPAVCPFRAQFPAQNSLGSVQIITQSCDSRCPHLKSETDKYATLMCGAGNGTTLKIEVESHPEKAPSPIIFPK